MLRHIVTTVFVVTGLMAFGSGCSDADKTARQMAQEMQTRIQALEAKAATDGQCKTMLNACRGSKDACMAPELTRNPPNPDAMKNCIAGFDNCIGIACQ